MLTILDPLRSYAVLGFKPTLMFLIKAAAMLASLLFLVIASTNSLFIRRPRVSHLRGRCFFFHLWTQKCADFTAPIKGAEILINFAFSRLLTYGAVEVAMALLH